MANQTPASAFEYEQVIESGIADIIAKELKESQAETDLRQVLSATASFVDDMVNQLMETAPPPQPLACDKGCSFCCWGFEVQVTPLEVLVIRDYLIEELSEDQLSLLMHALMGAAKDKDAFKARLLEGDVADDEPLPAFPCGLLNQGLCQAYDVRPMVCRGFNSFDAKTCEAVKTDPNSDAKIEGYVHPVRVAQAAFRGMNEGAQLLGLRADTLDLAPALGIALANVDCKERWFAGDDIFVGAKAILNVPDDEA